ncbi:MAG TPA: ArsB/NhaD family transporter [Limnochordia bacterium]|nr:ArsB/NhaD family transporter [Limnochordia bacterium]
MDAFLAIGIFCATVAGVLLRPAYIPEAVPALLGALAVLGAGLTTQSDLLRVAAVVGSAGSTIISTFIMASVLADSGFFKLASRNLIHKIHGSPLSLFGVVGAFIICATLFLNNDGAMILGMPVLIQLVRDLRLGKRAAITLLFSACVLASAASLPLGVSNLANLEAMGWMGITLLQHSETLALPSLAGLFALAVGLQVLVANAMRPNRNGPILAEPSPEAGPPPPAAGPPPRLHRPPLLHRRPGPPRAHRSAPPHPPAAPGPPFDRALAVTAIAVIIAVRIGFYVFAIAGWPQILLPVGGALVLILVRTVRRGLRNQPFAKAPWHVLGFAFGMELVVFALRNTGLLDFLTHIWAAVTALPPFAWAAVPAFVSSALAATMNNHPGLLVSTFSLAQTTLTGAQKLAMYGGIELGSDLGSLITPIGTLASLLWLHQLAAHGLQVRWGEYMRMAACVIPPALLAAVAVHGLLVAMA